MCKFCQWVYQCHFGNQYWLEDAVWSPMTGGTGSCELSFECWESKVRPCGWTVSVLSAEPSIQPHEHVINLSKVWLADLSSSLPLPRWPRRLIASETNLDLVLKEFSKPKSPQIEGNVQWMIRIETDNESLLKIVDYLTRAIRVSLSQIRFGAHNVTCQVYLWLNLYLL